MFGIGSTELLVILVVALLVLGPKSLAGVSRTLGKAVGEFRRVSNDFQRTLNFEAAQDDLRQKRKEAAVTGEKKSGQTNKAQEEQKIDLPPDSPVAQAIAKARVEAGQNKTDSPHA